VCWTSFPILWQSVFASLYPLLLVGVLGLVLRGVGFAFRKVTRTIRGRRVASLLFGSASILAPFCFSAALGAVASGRVGLGGPVAVGFAVLALLAIGAVFVMLWSRRQRFVRVLTIVGVGSFVFAWGFAQSPDLIPHRLTIAQGAGAASSLMWFGIVTIVAL